MGDGWKDLSEIPFHLIIRFPDTLRFVPGFVFFAVYSLFETLPTLYA